MSSYTYAELKKLGRPVLFTKCLHKSVNCKNRIIHNGTNGYCCVEECVITSENVIPVRSDFRTFTPQEAIKYNHQQWFKRDLEIG